jgi:hypothetical protein
MLLNAVPTFVEGGIILAATAQTILCQRGKLASFDEVTEFLVQVNTHFSDCR